ncbi:MAG: biopolymer transporter ExbD [Pseudomonadota bacterium]
MRRRAVHQQEASDVNVTPLLDIVFIMLIFFIVTSVFIDEYGIDLTNPDNNEDEENESRAESLLLSVTPEGLVRVNLARTIDPRSVRNTVESFSAENPNGSVIISAAPDSETGIAVLVLDQTKLVTSNVTLTLAEEQ